MPYISTRRFLFIKTVKLDHRIHERTNEYVRQNIEILLKMAIYYVLQYIIKMIRNVIGCFYKYKKCISLFLSNLVLKFRALGNYFSEKYGEIECRLA